jgi:hypothetical protein
VATRKDHFGCPGELFWLARGNILVGQGSQIKATQNLPDVRFLDIRFLFLSFANTMLSLRLPMRFGNIIRVETSRYLTRSRHRSRKFLQPSIRLRYNYYVQLVATRRDWMRVPNLKFWSPRQRGGWKLVVHITVLREPQGVWEKARLALKYAIL